MVISSAIKKVFRLRDGRLFGFSGSVENANILLNAIKKNAETPQLADTNALIVQPDGTILLYESTIWVKQNEAYYALGSGSPYAFGAMDFGASAREAVQAGIKRDTSSGGKVRSVSLNKKGGKK
jgi:20S proteasome alpha/beta subunit